MKTRLIAITTLVLMLALPPVALYAQEASPITVINAWAAALNAGDVEAALSYLADNAVLTFVPPSMPGDDGIFTGKEEIRAWYQGLVAAKGVTTLSDCQVKGEQVTCLDTYADAGLQGMGVDFLEAELVATVRGGKIQGYTVTMTPETLAKLAKLAPPPETLPKSGGTTPAATWPLWLVVGGLLAVTLGLGLRRVSRQQGQSK